MASLIKPGTVKVVAKEGEVQVSLTIDLNINLNTEGLSLGEKTRLSDSINEVVKKEEKVEWAIPDFEDAPKINFGKKEI